MKIWFTEIGEPLPFEEDVRLHRYGQFTKFLASKGHNVTWWTSTFSHSPKKQIILDEKDRVWEGVLIKFIRGKGYQKNVSLARFHHQQDFATKFYSRAKKEKDLPDLIISPIPTLEVAELAVKFGLENNIPVITDIRDQWPDEFVNMAPPILRGLAKLIFKPLYIKATYICSRASGIMAMSNNELNYGLKLSGREKGNNDLFFPLGYSLSKPDPVKIESAKLWLKELGFKGGYFTSCFFGTLGRFFNIETVLESARILKDQKFQFVIAGSGSSLTKYKKIAENLPNVIFTGWIDAPKIHAIMENSQVGLAPYKKDAVMSLPNKPFEYMAGSLPILTSIQGQLKDLLEAKNCGLTYEADSVEQFCHQLKWLKDNSNESRKMGRRGYQLLSDEYATDKVFTRAEAYLKKFVDERSE